MDEPAPRTRRRRPRRFVLPDHDDGRTNEAIEEFIAGTPRRRAHRRIPVSPTPPAPRQRPAATEPWSGLDSRVDWEAALRREEARVARYGRPATVLVLEVSQDRGSEPPGPARAAIRARLAQGVAGVLREQARDSDRLARVAEARFHVLLPETTEREAARYVARVSAAVATLGHGEEPVLTVGMAGARPGDGLAGALERAQAALLARAKERSERVDRAERVERAHDDRRARPA